MGENTTNTTHSSHSSGASHGQEENLIDAGTRILLALMVIIFMSAAFQYFRKYIKLPFTVLMFLFGLFIGLLALANDDLDSYTEITNMSPHVLFFVFLPVLIFDGATELKVNIFSKIFGQALILAGPGVLIHSGLVMIVMRYVLYDWTVAAALLFGALMSATDPVAVVAVLKELDADIAVSTLTDGEAMLNDGTAIILFSVCLPAVVENGHWWVWQEWLWHPITFTIGAFVWGKLCGILLLFLMVRTHNYPIVETMLQLAIIYIAFFLADFVFYSSGVLTLVTMGIHIASNRGMVSKSLEETNKHFWEVIVFMANALIFGIVGLIIGKDVISEASPKDWGMLFVLYFFLAIFRGLTLGIVWPLLNCFKVKLSWKHYLLLSYGALRGGVGLTLGLVVKHQHGMDPDVSRTIVFLTSGIVILYIVANGSTSKFLVQALGLNLKPAYHVYAYRHGQKMVASSMKNAIREYALHQGKGELNFPMLKDLATKDFVDTHVQETVNEETGEEELLQEEQSMKIEDKGSPRTKSQGNPLVHTQEQQVANANGTTGQEQETSATAEEKKEVGHLEEGVPSWMKNDLEEKEGRKTGDNLSRSVEVPRHQATTGTGFSRGATMRRIGRRATILGASHDDHINARLQHLVGFMTPLHEENKVFNAGEEYPMMESVNIPSPNEQPTDQKVMVNVGDDQTNKEKAPSVETKTEKILPHMSIVKKRENDPGGLPFRLAAKLAHWKNSAMKNVSVHGSPMLMPSELSSDLHGITDVTTENAEDMLLLPSVLRAMKTDLWVQREEALIGPKSFEILTNFLEECIDANRRFTFEEVIEIAQGTKLTSFQSVMATFFMSETDSDVMEYQLWTTLHDLMVNIEPTMISLMHASEKQTNLFSWVRSMKRQVEMQCSTLTESHPDIAAGVETQRQAHRVLRRGLSAVDELYSMRGFGHTHIEKIREELAERLHHLSFVDCTKIKRASFEDILFSSAVFCLSAVEDRPIFLKMATLHSGHVGEHMNIGACVGVVVSGQLSTLVQDKHYDFVMGDFFGLLASLSGLKEAAHVITTDFVITKPNTNYYLLPVEQLEQWSQENDPCLRELLWRLAASELARRTLLQYYPFSGMEERDVERISRSGHILEFSDENCLNITGDQTIFLLKGRDVKYNISSKSFRVVPHPLQTVVAKGTMIYIIHSFECCPRSLQLTKIPFIDSKNMTFTMMLSSFSKEMEFHGAQGGGQRYDISRKYLPEIAGYITLFPAIEKLMTVFDIKMSMKETKSLRWFLTQIQTWLISSYTHPIEPTKILRVLEDWYLGFITAEKKWAEEMMKKSCTKRKVEEEGKKDDDSSSLPPLEECFRPRDVVSNEELEAWRVKYHFAAPKDAVEDAGTTDFDSLVNGQLDEEASMGVMRSESMVFGGS